MTDLANVLILGGARDAPPSKDEAGARVLAGAKKSCFGRPRGAYTGRLALPPPRIIHAARGRDRPGGERRTHMFRLIAIVAALLLVFAAVPPAQAGSLETQVCRSPAAASAGTDDATRLAFLDVLRAAPAGPEVLYGSCSIECPKGKASKSCSEGYECDCWCTSNDYAECSSCKKQGSQ
jgi:hypothetical protein